MNFPLFPAILKSPDPILTIDPEDGIAARVCVSGRHHTFRLAGIKSGATCGRAVPVKCDDQKFSSQFSQPRLRPGIGRRFRERERRTVVVVSHDPCWMAFADRVATLRDGAVDGDEGQ
jgi:hypothetical protein